METLNVELKGISMGSVIRNNKENHILSLYRILQDYFIHGRVIDDCYEE